MNACPCSVFVRACSCAFVLFKSCFYFFFKAVGHYEQYMQSPFCLCFCAAIWVWASFFLSFVLSFCFSFFFISVLLCYLPVSSFFLSDLYISMCFRISLSLRLSTWCKRTLNSRDSPSLFSVCFSVTKNMLR